MSKQQVITELKELKKIIAEINRLNAECRVLRLKKKALEDNIMEYLDREQQEGVKYENIIVLSKERTTHKPLKKKEKDDKAIECLQGLGISNAKEMFENLKDSMKGEEIVVKSIQLKEDRLKNL